MTYPPAGPAGSPKVLPPAVMQAADSGGLLTNWWLAHAVAALTLVLAGLLVWRSCRKQPSAPRWQTSDKPRADCRHGADGHAHLAALRQRRRGFVRTSVPSWRCSTTAVAQPRWAPSQPRRHTPTPRGHRGAHASRNHTGTSSGAVDLAPRPRVGSGPGTLVQVAIPDPALGVPVGRTDIYLPAGYAKQAGTGARYPVVYLVHGYPAGRASNWMVSGRAPQALDALESYGSAQPDGNLSVDASGPSNGQDWECLNTAGGPRAGDLPHPRRSHLRRRACWPPGRTVTVGRSSGMSGGAFCALNLGLRHQDLYTAIMAIEPFDDPGGQALALLGGGAHVAGTRTRPASTCQTLHLRTPLTVYLADGSRSGSLPTARRLAGEFERAGVRRCCRSSRAAGTSGRPPGSPCPTRCRQPATP